MFPHFASTVVLLSCINLVTASQLGIYYLDVEISAPKARKTQKTPFAGFKGELQ
jgi:hypothetical protein